MPQSYVSTGFTYRFGKFEFDPDRRLLSRDGLPVRVGSRAMAILEVFLTHPGTPITTEALILSVWKNRHVDKGSVKVNLAALRKVLGRTEDGREHILTEPGRGYIFVTDITNPNGEVLLGESTTRLLNFQTRLTPIIGREEVLEKLSLQSNRGRLLTITGGPGIGKTTIAVAVAERVAKEYSNGAIFLDLASLSDPPLVSATIAAQMGVLARSTDPIDDIAAYLRHQRALIVMDNCEHLADELSRIIEILLGNAVQIDIIATSREPLSIPVEKIEKIEPLRFPNDVFLSPEAAMSASAVRLFVARAQAVSDFQLTADNLHLVTSICRRLDGLPLAIELACALLPSLSLEQIQSKIDNHLQELPLGFRTAPSRHQSLHNLLEWSYLLLLPEEKKAFADLSVFRRSFGLDGAAKLLQLDEPSAIGLLNSLTSKSLLVSNERGSRRVYRMLETTRAFATQKLDQAGRRDEVARQHAEHIADLFGNFDPLRANAHRELMTSLLDDQRSALDWALSFTGDLRIASKLAAKAAPVLFGMGLDAESREQVDKTLVKIVKADEALDISMRARYALFLCQVYGGRMDLALTQAKNVLNDAARAGDDAYIAIGHRMCGLCEHSIGNHNEAMKSVTTLREYNRPANATKASARLSNFSLYDFAITSDVLIARVLLLDGKVSQAMTTIQNAERRASDLGHWPTLFYLYIHGACLIPLMLQRAELSKRFVMKLTSYVSSIYAEKDSVRYQWGPLFSGWQNIVEGAAQEGISAIQGALVSLGNEFAKYTPTNVVFYAALAEGQLSTGQIDAAVSTLDQGLKCAGGGWGSWYDPELLRLRGEALIAIKRPAAEIENALKESVQMAEKQGALFWQFKSTISLAEFYASVGRSSLAKRVIEPVYDKCLEDPKLPWFQRATKIMAFG
jgi:predicted ATPase/DNA-binding winged helix-turn-helix (wHTH) protein